jgi:hypothetical protein
MNSFLFRDDFNERSLALFTGNGANNAPNGANHSARLANYLANIFFVALDMEASNANFDILGDLDGVRVVDDALDQGFNQFRVSH